MTEGPYPLLRPGTGQVGKGEVTSLLHPDLSHSLKGLQCFVHLAPSRFVFRDGPSTPVLRSPHPSSGLHTRPHAWDDFCTEVQT